jgi:hypothetical protein
MVLSIRVNDQSVNLNSHHSLQHRCDCSLKKIATALSKDLADHFASRRAIVRCCHDLPFVV